jgi:molecular chaperone GrpE
MEETTIPEQPETPAAAPAPTADLQKELDESRAKAAENLDGWQRERAAFANYKRRVEKEQAEAYQTAAARIIARYLEVADDFERALKDRPSEGDGARWAEGVTLIQRKLQAILESEGVTRIEAEGQEFDPALHEAVTHEDSEEHPAGHIIEVLRQGYRLGERVIRPAFVRVAR